MGDGLNISAPGNSHNLLSVIDAGVPAIVGQPGKSSSNFRESKIMEKYHRIRSGIFGTDLRVSKWVFAVVVSVNENQVPPPSVNISKPNGMPSTH